MSDREAFLAAIEAVPADLLAKGVYADWLDENGEFAFAKAFRRWNPKRLEVAGVTFETRHQRDLDAILRGAGRVKFFRCEFIGVSLNLPAGIQIGFKRCVFQDCPAVAAPGLLTNLLDWVRDGFRPNPTNNTRLDSDVVGDLGVWCSDLVVAVD